ncbi:hypothetical protein DAPK24_004750 [Pichia kluyveri]|uniref:General alpha-glucoside permease n=1 Tax=Pichia kluyveri TaxID=36015 RepID=A0AAV5QXL1_PICKL|nr:hypothetical protein DAPK24_004750 [Pichia kluyveri]
MQHLYNPHRSTAYVLTVTLILGALQLAWSVEFSEVTPFLLSLGLSKRILSLVWLAGPLSGSIGQPIVGLLSDRCMLSYGRRRIFIIIGCLLTCLSLIFLSHSKNFISWILTPFNLSNESLNTFIIVFACIGIYILDFSIAIIQASSRALIVDVVPTDQQQVANAWAARMIGIFNLFGFWLGTLNLIQIFPFLGDSQFKVLTIIVAFLMILLTSFSIYLIKERNPQTDVTLINQRETNNNKLNSLGIKSSLNDSVLNQLINFFKEIFISFKTIPNQVKIVCYAQLFAWIGYFPLLFYTTSYVGELFLYNKGYPNPNLIPPELKDELLNESTRVGTYALLSNSIVSLIIVSFLPIILKKYLNYDHSSMFHSKSIFKLNLRSLWIYSHVVFTLCTLSTFFIHTYQAAIIVFAFTGIPWGCAVWIPFSLISEEISRIKDIKAIQIYYNQQIQNDPIIEDDAPLMTEENSIYCKQSLIDYYNNIEYDSGILLALHNVFVSAPQMISSFMSSILFTIFHNKDSNNYDTSLEWVFRFGGLLTIGAWYISRKVKTNEELFDDDKLRAISSDF